MSCINKVILIGNAGKDPENKSSNQGLSITNFSLATQRKVKEETKVQWHYCVAFGKTADVIATYVVKGSKLYVEGEITYEKYKDKDGNEKSATKIIVNQVAFLGDSGNKKQDGHSEYTGEYGGNKKQANPSKNDKWEKAGVDEFDDGIPF